MSRLLFLLALLFIGWWLWQRLRRRDSTQLPDDRDTITTVRCRLCGTHVARDQAVSLNDHWYCCRAHAEQDERSEQR